jgi:hypothetical protein
MLRNAGMGPPTAAGDYVGALVCCVCCRQGRVMVWVLSKLSRKHIKCSEKGMLKPRPLPDNNFDLTGHYNATPPTNHNSTNHVFVLRVAQ